ncbi:MAG: alpha/beta fold hydrolase [Pseudomonadota bacterium]
MADRTSDGTAFEINGPDNAPVIVLIHGLGMSRKMWQWHVPALAERYHVVSYDLCGHGESTRPDARLSLPVFADQLRALLDHADIAKAAIVGYSLGGMINRRFTMDHPDRVAALVILNSPHERGPEAQKLVEERAADTAAGGPAANIDTSIARWFTPDFRETRPDIIALARQWILANDPEVYAQARQVLAQGVVELVHPQPPIAAPSLVITTENDSGSTPAMSHGIAREIAGAEIVIIPSLQHMGLVEEPELFTNPVLRFLDETLP